MASKYYDVASIVQVVGCVYNNPSLLDFSDKYSINEEDFEDIFHRTVFGAIYRLHELGADKITLSNISDFFESRPKSKAIYESGKGEEWLLSVSHNAEPRSFDYYYNRMKKMTLLRAYNKIAGIDVSDLYDPDNIMDAKKRQVQEEWLDSVNLLEIAQQIDDKVDRIKMQYIDEADGEATTAGTGLRNLLDRLAKYPDAGIPLYGPLINTVTRGARLKKLYLRSAPSGAGKAIPDYTFIPTPQGWKRVGDIRPGDYLFARDGKPTKVLQIHPQPEKKEIWKVTFADGKVAECCEEHLWEYYYDSHRGEGKRVENIRTIYERSLRLKNGLKNTDGGYRFSVAKNLAVEYPTKIYSVDPYVMGALLGDGSFRYTLSQKALTFSTAEEELANAVAKLLHADCYAHKNSDYNYNYTFKMVDNPNHNLWVEEIFKDYPMLWNIKSEHKFIPEAYLMGDVEQRYSLLQGLLDTDGHIDQKGRVGFTTISPALRDNIIELCYSLGMTASFIIDQRPDKYTTGECYQIHIQAPKDKKPNMFRLARKKNMAIAYSHNTKRAEHKNRVAIVNIEPTNIKTKMTCFTVDNSEHLFLMNDWIVTHNTRSMIADVCQIGCNMIYDDMFGWIKNGTAQPVLYITTEQELEEVQTMMLAFLSAVNEEHILSHRYEGDEEDRVIKAAEILENSKIYIIELPDFSLADVENIIRHNIRDNDIKYVFFDYIMTSLKILGEIAGRAGGVKIREDNILFMLSRRLKDLANEYGVFILSGTQLSGDWKDSEIPDQSLLRGAKSIADSIDLGMILLPPNKKDLESLESILSNNTFDTPNLKISVYKNRRGRYKGVYLWCKADLGICRIKPMFCTTYNYEIISIEDLKIFTSDDEESAF